MDNISEFISSGIIEMYCMGLTNEAETAEVVRVARLHKEVRDEILEVTESLSAYAAELQRQPKKDLRSRILKSIEEESASNLPPKIFENSSIAFWNQYLQENNIKPPA